MQLSGGVLATLAQERIDLTLRAIHSLERGSHNPHQEHGGDRELVNKMLKEAIDICAQ